MYSRGRHSVGLTVLQQGARVCVATPTGSSLTSLMASRRWRDAFTQSWSFAALLKHKINVPNSQTPALPSSRVCTVTPPYPPEHCAEPEAVPNYSLFHNNAMTEKGAWAPHTRCVWQCHSFKKTKHTPTEANARSCNEQACFPDVAITNYNTLDLFCFTHSENFTAA